ncbi:MAG: peptidase E [Actinobacteria bacterium]|nr:peptidase E [Actinomycetota bacterium]
MTVRRVMATSGGFVATDLWDVMKPGKTLLRMLELTGKERPRVCFILTASGDNAQYLARSYAAMSDTNCDVTHLQLFTQPNAPVFDRIMESDVIWVGGGSVANLLAVWQLHEVGAALTAAYQAGKIIGGVSAGSICWHQGGPTDSYGAKLRTVTNSLGLLPYGNAVHFDSEVERRPFAHQLIKDEVFEKIYATDDGVGMLYENEIPVEVIVDKTPTDPSIGPAAYVLTKVNGEVLETRLANGVIN